MSILSNIDIENICSFLDVPLLGVICKDELPKKLTTGAFVLNMANSDQPGTHWVALIVDDQKNAAYFDSYGCPPPEEVVKYTKRCKHVYYNTDQIQAVSSTDCGWFCIAFLHFEYFNHGINLMTKFTDMFHKQKYLARNDKILKDYIKRAMKEKERR
jgi:hypothetical protein